MTTYEPFWDIEKGPWPGTYDSSGKPRMGDVHYASHLGAWCAWESIDGLGVVATDECQFTNDGRFVWLSLTEINNKNVMVKRAGTWKLAKETLSLVIETSDEPDVMPCKRMDLRISDRMGQLSLVKTRNDDQQAKNICSYNFYPARVGDSIKVLQTASQKARLSGPLPPPFKKLEAILASEIPVAIQKLKLKEPLFCLRLYYFDTHVPRENDLLQVRVLTESLRKKLAKEHTHPENLAEELWSPQIGAANGIAGQTKGLYAVQLASSKELTKCHGDLHDLLGESEQENMPLLQELARRVCKKLNKLNWGEFVPVTDDFVAFPADGSNFFGEDYEADLIASASAANVKTLKKRGYLV